MTPPRAGAAVTAPRPGDRALYVERVPTAPFTRALLVAAATTLVAAGWIASPGESLLARTFFRLSTLGAATVILSVGWRIHDMTIEVSEKALRIMEGRRTRSVPIEAIDHAEAAIASRTRVRVPGRGTLHDGVLYVSRQGPAVVVHRVEGPPLAFSSASPHGVVEAVDEAVRHQRAHEVRPALTAGQVVVLEAV